MAVLYMGTFKRGVQIDALDCVQQPAVVGSTDFVPPM